MGFLTNFTFKIKYPRFLNEVSVGDEIMCTTRDNTYSGVIDQLHKSWMSIQGDNFSWIVEYKNLTFYAVV